MTIIYYEISALYAQLNNITESINWLEKSIQKGHDKWDLIRTDRDLDNIRDSSYFKELLKSAPNKNLSVQ